MTTEYGYPEYRIFTWDEFHERVRTRIYAAVGRQRPGSKLGDVYIDISFSRAVPDVVTSGKCVFGLLDEFGLQDEGRRITCGLKDRLAQLLHRMMTTDGRSKITLPQFAHLMQFVTTLGELSDAMVWR